MVLLELWLSMRRAKEKGRLFQDGPFLLYLKQEG